MAHGYTGDGWGAHGDHGDEDFVREWYGNEGRDRGRRQAMSRDEGRYQSRAWDGGRQGRQQIGTSDRERGWQSGGSYAERGRIYRDRFGNEEPQDRYSRNPQRGVFGWAGDFRQENQPFSSRQDDHYLSWRDKQVQGLDRDYQDYCREREQQFHQDFDSWRQTRQSRPTGAGFQPEQARGDRGGELTLTPANEIGSGRTGRGRSRS